MVDIIGPEVKKLLKSIQGNKCTILSYAIVRLYTASPGQKWVNSQQEGVLCLVHDREQNSPFFRLFEPVCFDLIFECQIYLNFAKNYKMLSTHFYYFQLFKGFIGFSFGIETEATEMNQIIQNIHLYQKEQLEKNKKAQGSGLIGWISRMMSKNLDEEGKDDEDKIEISKPEDVQHSISVKYDYEKQTFDIQSLDPSTLALFKNAGISEQEMNDAQYAPYIFEAILQFQENMDTFIQEQEANQSDLLDFVKDLQDSFRVMNNP